MFVLVALLGLAFLFIAALYPLRWGKTLVVSVIIICGLIYEKCNFLDEYIVACVLIGGMMVLTIGRIDLSRSNEDRSQRLHRLLFTVMMVYMILESWRGMMVTDVKKIRWVIYFIMLGIMAFMISRKGFSIPKGRELARILVVATLIYFVLFLVQGVFSTYLYGTEWYNLQNIKWGGSSYAVYPLVIGLPASFMGINDEEQFYRRLSWLCIFVMGITSLYYDTRSGYFIIIAYTAIAIVKMNLKQALLIGAGFLTILLIFISFVFPSYEDWEGFWSTTIFESSKLLWSHDPDNLRTGDLGRFAHMMIGPKIMEANPEVMLIGTGYRASEDLVAPTLMAAFLELNQPGWAEKNVGYGSTIGITEMLVETGTIGIVILLSNMFVTAKQVMAGSEKQMRWFLLLSLACSFTWLVVTNPVDQVLFYFLIMPNGLIVQLSKRDS